MKTLMVYSKANRRQLITSDMAYALVLIFEDIGHDKIGKEISVMIKNMTRHIRTIQGHLYDGQKLVLKTKDLQKYQKTIKKIQAMIDDIFNHANSINLDFISGILGICSDQCDEVQKFSKRPEYIHAWVQLVNELQKFYQHYDPEMQYDQCSETGALISDTIKAIIKEA